MKFIWKGNLTQNFKVFINRVGYYQQMDRNSGQVSYIRRLGRLFYPRFHLYIDQEEGKIVFKLHLDEKKASYEGSNRHSGQYEGELVEKEMYRIISIINS
ncbi:MAG: hypothetical protein ACNFW9_01495 [Candidatus Kerfeldbacteria bacterium]